METTATTPDLDGPRRPAAGPGPVSEPPGLVGRAATSLVLLVLAGVSLAGVATQSPPPPAGLLAVDVAVGVVGSIALPLFPPGHLGTAWTVVALAAVTPTATPLAATATLWVARRRTLPVAAATAAAGVTALVVRAVWRPAAGIAFGWWFALVVAAWAALVGWGAWRQAHVALVASLQERARRAEQDQAERVAEARRAERRRIAGEMHDVLAHRLTLLTTHAGALEYRAETRPEQLRDAVGVIRTAAHDALEDLRDVVEVLRDDETRPGRPAATMADLPDLVAASRAAGADVRLDVGVPIQEVPAPLGRTVHRVVKEALTNARKHAPGSAVVVRVGGAPGQGLEVDVANTAPPAPVGDPPPGGGLGLVGLTERVGVDGGHLDHGPTGDGGYRVHATFGWPP